MKKLLPILLLASCTAIEPSRPNLIKLAPVCDLSRAKNIKAGIAKCYDELDAIQNAPVVQEKRLLSDKAREFTEDEKAALDLYAGEALEIALHSCIQQVVIEQCGDVWKPVAFEDTDQAKFVDCNMIDHLKERGMATLGAIDACKVYERKE